MFADVAFSDGPQKRVADRMDQNIRVWMAFQSSGVGNFDPSEDKFTPFREAMNIKSDANFVTYILSTKFPPPCGED